MFKDQLIDYDFIASGNFFTEAVSAAHRYIDPPSTYIRYANEHRHDRLLCVISGSCKFDMFNDKPIIAKSGSVIYIPYNIAYRTEWIGDERGELYSINYIMKDTDGHQITLCPEIYMFEGCDMYITKGLFTDCCYTFTQKKFGYRLKCKYTMLKILLSIANTQSKISHSKIGKAIQYIEANYLEDISINELARMCNLGECMFRRCFKTETGTSPLKYRNRLRINKAYEMLSTEGCSVAEAMETTGFYDASYFNKTFKSYIGKSPSECKNSRRNI